MPDYRVIIEGTTLLGFDHAVVVEKLASLTKQNEATAARLLSGQPTIVKSQVDQPTALRYQNAFRTIGVAARIEELETLSFDIPDAPPPLAPQTIANPPQQDVSAISRKLAFERLSEQQPQIIVRTYRGRQHKATALFQADATRLAAQGYVPTSQSWAPGAYGCGAFLLGLALCLLVIGFVILIYMLLVKPPGTLTVTYQRS